MFSDVKVRSSKSYCNREINLNEFYRIRGKAEQLLILFSKLVLGKRRGKDRREVGHIEEEEGGVYREGTEKMTRLTRRKREDE